MIYIGMVCLFLSFALAFLNDAHAHHHSYCCRIEQQHIVHLFDEHCLEPYKYEATSENGMEEFPLAPNTMMNVRLCTVLHARAMCSTNQWVCVITGYFGRTILRRRHRHSKSIIWNLVIVTSYVLRYFVILVCCTCLVF